MGIRPAITTAFLATLALSGWHFGATDTTLQIPLNHLPGLTAFVRLETDEPVGLLLTRTVGGVTVHTDGNYRIQLFEVSSNGRSIVRLTIEKTSGEAFRLSSFSVIARAPRTSLQGIWHPGADSNSTDVMAAGPDESINDVADANFGIPYLAAASRSANNVLAIGLGRQDLAVSILGRPVGASYELQLKALTARTAARFEEAFYVSVDPSITWEKAAADYADWVDDLTGYVPFPVSRRAYEPLYDTWYWSGDRVDERLYLDTAMLAAELGIGMYLADSGWDADEGEYDKWLAGKTGDYSPPAAKFSNLKETFSILRSEGNLGIDLWLQPFAVGRESVRYSPTRDLHIQLPKQRYPNLGWGGLDYAPFVLPVGENLESVNLCPRASGTHEYLRQLFTEIAAAYAPEGYWLDFIDGLASYCVAPHAHQYSSFGAGLNGALQAVKETILARDPDSIVHFRAPYANLNTKRFANVWQSVDSPGDYKRMRLSSIRLRPFSKGVVFASDQMYWPEDTSESETSKFIMTSVMTGAPAFGPSLVYSPPETLEILRSWLRFYRNNQAEFNFGSFSTFGRLDVPNHRIDGAERTFAYIENLDFTDFPAANKTMYFMNASSGDVLRARIAPTYEVEEYSAQILTRYLAPDGSPIRIRVDRSGFANLDVSVEQGGIVELTAVEKVEESPE